MGIFGRGGLIMLYWANYIVRNQDGVLWVFSERPCKDIGDGTNGVWVVDFDEQASPIVDAHGKYDGVKWEDEFPTHIVWK